MHEPTSDRTGADGARSAIVFVAERVSELSWVARQHRFDALAYLLDMAKLEAEIIRREMGSADK